MIRRSRKNEKNLGPTLVVSFLSHLLLIVIFSRAHLFMASHLKEAPVYYVDLVNLPVANPQAGTPVVAGEEGLASPAPKPTPPEEMKLPVKPAAKQLPAKAAPAPAPPVEQPANGRANAREFEERLVRIQRQSDARHASAALDALKKKVAAAGGRTGMPGATGTENGSDYASYIRSRLENAFRLEDTFKPDRNKLVKIRLYLGKNGRIVTLKIETNSSDKMFNDAVMRAIARAENDFKPPPGGGQVELGFTFKNKEVSER